MVELTEQQLTEQQQKAAISKASRKARNKTVGND